MTPTLVAGRYRLGAELGRGGMGVVWEAYDELLHRAVAVKEVRYPTGISTDERERLARRTLREARAVAAVEDPHAVRVFDIVEQDGRPWIVMEVVRGRTLTDVIRAQGALPAAEVARIGVGLLEALAAAHRAGVLHRDVKPSNVILGDDGRVALTDFGIATVDSDPTDVTTSGQIVGSPAYMAPERARGERPSPAADLWSLGATLWTAAEGRPPYAEGNAFATMTKVVSEEPPACSRCDGSLGAVIGSLMSREPAARPSASEARQRLEAVRISGRDGGAPYPTEPLPPAFDRTMALDRPRVADPAPVAAEPAPALVAAAPAPVVPPPVDPPPAPVGPRTPRRRSRLPVLAGLVGLLVVALVVGAAIALTRSGGSGAGAAVSPPSHHPTTKPSSKASSTKPSQSASASPAAASVPSGWSHYTDPSVGWSIGVPPGWRIDHSDGSTFLRDPAGGRYLQVDTKYPAGPSAKGAWEDQERAFRSSHSGYQRIRLETVSWRSYPDVADWEFTYTSGAATLRADDRGAVVANRGYGLFFQTHSDQWAASQGMLQSFYASFQPTSH